MKSHKITLLGTGLIGQFYTMTLHRQRGRDRVHTVYSQTEEKSRTFAQNWGIPNHTSDMEKAVTEPETDVVIIGIPNDLHEKAVHLAVGAGKSVLCTKPLGRRTGEARSMLEAVEKAGVFAGYLEDLCYTPKTLKALQSVKDGALGTVLWARSRETHPGPHSAWFWDRERAGGGAIVDLGCHCIEIIRNFIGKDIRPVEVMCTSDTLVHPIEAEDSAVGLIRFANKALGQFEVSWTFRGGMDLRDEVSGTEGTIWLNHFLRTGFEMFTTKGQGGYVAEKTESESGWLFPVGDEVVELGYKDMFIDMFNSMEKGTPPMETFYDGYVVNAIIDSCYRSARSKKWEPVELFEWRGKQEVEEIAGLKSYDANHYIIKTERMPDGKTKTILKNKETGEITENISKSNR
jgi:predicted dehydrogenase